MNAKTVISSALVVTVLGLGSVRAQTPGAMNPLDTVPPPTGLAASTEPLSPAQALPQSLQLSSWIRGDKYNCCAGNTCGSSGPIQGELFFRTGPSLVLGSGTISDVLQTGWYVGGGARTLFFDPSLTSAWTLEVGVANVYNHAHAPVDYPGIPLNILVTQGAGLPALPKSFGQNGLPGVTLESLDRTYFDFGPGREWYLRGSAGCGGMTWRVGCDGGGRWGSESANFNEIPHRSDTIGGLWASVHTDLEIPCGCCVFQAGFRVEYGYTWSDILQIQNKSDTQDVNILFNMGVRF